MKGKPTASRLALLGLLMWAICVTPANAVDWRPGEWLISWDNRLTYGISVRTADRDESIIGLANGGSAFSVNGDDGNLNYDTGIFSNQLQLTSELEFSRNNFGFFFRGWGFYDYENENNDRAREETPLTDEALKRVGSRFELRDAYAWFNFRIGKQPAQIRAGRQVVNWGESTFIQGGLNILNPVDVTALRGPGAELRNALLPVGMVWGSFSISTNTSIEAFYEYEWEEIIIDPPGSYFSANDFAGDGGEYVFLGFGSSGDVPPFLSPGDPTRPFLGVPRESSEDPSDTGQYGLVFRWLVPNLGDTEFGFYYANYHSRLPTINGRTGTLDGAISAGGAGAATVASLTELGTSGDPQAAIAAGVQAGTANGASVLLATTTSTAVVGTALQGGDAVAVGTAFATDAYAQTARYFIAYPEDIKLYGISFNSQIGTTGLALQGELSYRQDAPLQVDDVELLFAALQPVNPALSQGPGASQLTTYTGIDYSTSFETPIAGYILEDTSQFQTTLTKIWPQAAGADQILFLFEAGVTHVPGMPETDELRLETSGTYTSGNAYHSGANPGSAHTGKAAEPASAFADPTSWGYRLVTRFQYNNAIGAITLSPRFAWGHDVSGNSPGPGAGFIEDRKAYTLGLNFDWQGVWSADIAYTDFFGASRYNLVNDRDFVAMNFRYAF